MMKIPDEFIEAFEALSEGSLDETGRARLLAMLRQQPHLVEVVRRHLEVAWALEHSPADDSAYAAGMAEHVERLGSEGEHDFVRKVMRRVFLTRSQIGLAAAAAVVLALVPIAWRWGLPDRLPNPSRSFRGWMRRVW